MKTANYTVPTGRGVLGRIMDADGEAIDGLGSLVDLPHTPVRPFAFGERSLPDGMLETGIKVIDLMAPIARGGTVQISGPYGTGAVVLFGELIRNRSATGGGCAVWVGLEERPDEWRDMMQEFRETGAARHLASILVQGEDVPETRVRAVQAGWSLAEFFRERGDVRLFLDERLLHGVAEDLAGWRGMAGEGSVTLVLAGGVAYGAGAELDDPDGRIVMSRALADRAIYPAVDPLESGSPILETGAVGEAHVQAARQVREALRRERELQEEIEQGGPDHLSETDRVTVDRARRMQQFFTQPFFGAQLYTAIPGAYVMVGETVRGFGALAEGRVDDLPEEAFRFVGRLEQAVEKANGAA